MEEDDDDVVEEEEDEEEEDDVDEEEVEEEEEEEAMAAKDPEEYEYSFDSGPYQTSDYLSTFYSENGNKPTTSAPLKKGDSCECFYFSLHHSDERRYQCLWEKKPKLTSIVFPAASENTVALISCLTILHGSIGARLQAVSAHRY